MVLSLASWFALQMLLESMGWMPRPKPEAEVAAAEKPKPLAPEALKRVTAFADEPDGPKAFADDDAPPALAQAPAAPNAPVELVSLGELMLGAVDPKADRASGYHLRVGLTQRGAGVRRVSLAAHEAETTERGKPAERLAIIDAPSNVFPDATRPPLGIDLVLPGKGDNAEDVRPLGENDWEVVRDNAGRVVRPLAADPSTGKLEGEAIVFRTKLADLGLTVLKTIGLRRGSDALELDLRFEAARPIEFSYRLQGPYGIPVEGAWYTSLFREVFFGKLNGKVTEIETKAANEVVEREQKGDPIRATSLPLLYAGVENQYFAVFLEPRPLPQSEDQRWDEKTVATVIHPEAERHKSEVSVVIDSRAFEAAPNAPLEHAYYLYAGPKSAEALAPYGATDLSSYRKGWQIPIIGSAATFLARTVISPLLDQIYGFTKTVARVFGGKNGNYGIAIILLTIAVRLLMFPLSRKQAQSAKRMQDLQPQLLALREKYKDDKEKIGRETLVLYQKNGVNPLGGCLLVLIQMPIFLGLWQSLNNSVALRKSGFLWIKNLAAPDQLFPFPFEIPLIGGFLGPYFNLLPFIVIVLMLVQTKLFSPPATTPEMQQQQSMMKWMLVFMMMMFYKVPAGLSLYFIVSSMWSIGERLLLPKITKSKPVVLPDAAADRPSSSRDSEAKPPGWRDRLRERLEQVMEEAAHDKTARNEVAGRARDDGNRARPRRPRPKR